MNDNKRHLYIDVVTISTGAVGTTTFASGIECLLAWTLQYGSIEKDKASRAGREDRLERTAPLICVEKVLCDNWWGSHWVDLYRGLTANSSLRIVIVAGVNVCPSITIMLQKSFQSLQI